MDPERRAALRAILNLVTDGQRCLTDAISETKIRKLVNDRDGLFILGACGAARSGLRFAANAVRHALGEPLQ